MEDSWTGKWATFQTTKEKLRKGGTDKYQRNCLIGGGIEERERRRQEIKLYKENSKKREGKWPGLYARREGGYLGDERDRGQQEKEGFRTR